MIRARHEGAPASEAAELAERSLEGASGVFESPMGAAQFKPSGLRAAVRRTIRAGERPADRRPGRRPKARLGAYDRRRGPLEGAVGLAAGFVARCRSGQQVRAPTGQRHGILAIEPGQRALVIEILLARGDPAGADALLATTDSAQMPDGLTFNFLLEARAGVRLAQGRHSQALADLEEFSRRESGLGPPVPRPARGDSGRRWLCTR